MHFYRPIIFARFPVPKPKLAVRVTRSQELSIWAEFQTTRVALIHMACESFLFVLLEVAFTIKSENFIVH